MPIGHPLPRLRVPALTEGNVVSLDLSQFKGRWIAICCPSRFGLVESLFLDRCRQELATQEALLLGLVTGPYPFHEPWIQQASQLGLILLSDPLRRISRALKMYTRPDQGRCQSLIVNPRGMVEYHLVHDLNGRGMSAFSKIFQLCKNFQIRLRTPLEQAAQPGPRHGGQPFSPPSGSTARHLTTHRHSEHIPGERHTLGVRH